MMTPLHWSLLLLCLSASAEHFAEVKPGDSFTVECSAAGCPISAEGYIGMYLYRGLEERDEVLYIHHKPESTDKVSPRIKYSKRIQTSGSMKKNSITFSNLTVNDNGLYACVYIKTDHEVRCSVYILFVNACPRMVEPVKVLAANTTRSYQCERSPSLLLIIITICTITMLVTIIVTLLVISRVKRLFGSRGRRLESKPPDEYVYEVMGKNSFNPPPEQTSRPDLS
ncbi:hypothetical protein LDENG_00221590 [Lucifuga dentata]|nr:hypothetical protein LDENG_00221590 [Lucifuga dentata]